ncbi:MAG TPA: hypothetical protein ENG70_03125 [Candidatus Cloacimonetes bacterium]|nr:hypothetical protein [Candidatus Cloacimonadota bacterium]HEX37836.1 hypothetical protein [Candidatus Cloacimonadota bacterium]
MFDIFFEILPIFYFLVFCVTFFLRLWAYKETNNKSPLYIGIGFGILALIFLLNIIPYNNVVFGITILMRIIAYLLVLYGVYNFGISLERIAGDNKQNKDLP